MENDKKLTRSTKNKMIGGVCAGFAEYFNLDVTLVRLLFVLIGLAGHGIIFYIIAWIIIPPDVNA
jgi:phage shock protein C